MSPPRQMTHKEWWDEGVRLYGADPTKWRFRCARCNGSQSVEQCVAAGMTADEAYFNCIGRRVDNIGCDWTLGGLFRIHTLEIMDEEGKAHPAFEFADSLLPSKEVVAA